MKYKKPAIAIVSVVLILAAILFFVTKQESGNKQESTTNQTIKGDSNISIALNDDLATLQYKGYTFKNELVETEKGIESEDTTYTYDVYEKRSQVGKLTVTVREVSNGDQFVFTKFENQSDKDITLPTSLVLQDTYSYKFNNFVEEEPVREHDRVFGIDHTTNVKGLYSISGKHDFEYDLFLSQNYISKQLTTEYEDGEISTLRELVSEDRYIDINQDNNTMSFNLLLRTTGGGQISENWFILSKEKLFENEEVLNSYKSKTNYNFIHAQKWLTADGNYTKLPWSIEPGTKLGYGRNLVALQDKTAMDGYRQTKERFYYDMVVNSVNNLLNFKAADDKLWETEYTSTWLKRDYGIRAPYTDTRHNENIALFLTNAGKELGIESIEKSYLLYADFLSNQEKMGNVIATDNGYYITDYFSEDQTKKTHVSLNHALGEMNFLLSTYKETSDEKYLETALAIKRGVEDMGTKWINPENGDLWYQINGDYTFYGEDYETLTLEDLTTSLTNFREMDIEYDEVFHELVKSKCEYIVKSNIEILNSTVTILNELGLGEPFANYTNIISF